MRREDVIISGSGNTAVRLTILEDSVRVSTADDFSLDFAGLADLLDALHTAKFELECKIAAKRREAEEKQKKAEEAAIAAELRKDVEQGTLPPGVVAALVAPFEP